MPSYVRLLGLMLISLVVPFLSVQAASLDGLAVDVENQSEPVLCAEKDNVAVAFSNPDVRSFRIEAAHPVYLSSSMRSNIEPDWTACDMSSDPIYKSAEKPKKITLVGEPNLWLVGYTYPSFWRPSTATVRVGKKVYKNIHLLQVWVIKKGRADEVLVLYPQDGYWRPRPMTPRNMSITAYGSSFLVGPIEKDGRPLVKIKEAVFEPQKRQFDLSFEKGGSATVRIASVDSNRLALDVAFDHGVSGGPFAMLRSMYVTEFNNDTARIAVREQGAKGWREDNIMKFDHARATDIWIGRLTPSQHNTTSPDVVFNSFSDGPSPKRPKSEVPTEVSTKPIK
ncbi:hypothetical protein RLW55_13180 [Hyphomicrobium sp. B1]|uniref:hypothetical protein n=1 Tax=unclassified Hyphomicrobium TaxID=2619925 RepID=UPI0039191C75